MALGNKLLLDISFGEDAEDNFIKKLKADWWEVQRWHKTSILDFHITRQPEDKRRKLERYYIELKTRNWVSSKTFPDTMIGANKLAEAWYKYYKEWIETLFIFTFTDWTFYYNPIEKYRTEFRPWRRDRGSNVDSAKGWIFIKELLKFDL